MMESEKVRTIFVSRYTHPAMYASTLLEETPHCFMDGQPQMTVVRMYGCWFHQVTSSLLLALS